jgi:hypothetical protein
MQSPDEILKAAVTLNSIALATELALLFSAEDVSAADRSLDDARRLMWYSAFAGADDAAVERWAGADQNAIIVATRLKGLPLAVASQVVELTRMTVWAAKFSKVAGSQFAEIMARRVGSSGRTGRWNG